MPDHLPPVTLKVTLSSKQVRFLMDLMMGCPLGYTKDHAVTHDVDDSALYNHLLNCLPDAHRPPD